ncbi:hypothetical protein GCM10022280_18810 [Sphingomonas swuensis]|uniref:Exonuclease domain-containing protein n=1 Tax=Sphingomonas swuensis TaxID=977800 RepID=A0ABP7T0G4_9SPHN
MPVFRVIDLETTGIAPPAEVIEVGITDVEVSPSEVNIASRDRALQAAWPDTATDDGSAPHH